MAVMNIARTIVIDQDRITNEEDLRRVLEENGIALQQGDVVHVVQDGENRTHIVE